MLPCLAAAAEEGGVHLGCGLGSRAGRSWGHQGPQVRKDTLGTELSLSLEWQLTWGRGLEAGLLGAERKMGISR